MTFARFQLRTLIVKERLSNWDEVLFHKISEHVVGVFSVIDIRIYLVTDYLGVQIKRNIKIQMYNHFI